MNAPKLPASAKPPAAPTDQPRAAAAAVTPIQALPRSIAPAGAGMPKPAPAFATGGTIFDALPADTAAARQKTAAARQLLSAAVRSAQAALVQVKRLEGLGAAILTAEGLPPVTLAEVQQRLAALVDAFSVAPPPADPPAAS